MAILRVARLGHPVLRKIAAPVPPDQVDSPEIQRLIADLLETMEAYDGAGLAAPQVHVSLRVVVLRLRTGDPVRVWINPRLQPLDERQVVTMEGCLSVPGLRGAVPRFAALRVEALERDGSPVELHLQGHPAVVAQHECDHLDGVLYVDRALPRSLVFLEEMRKFGSPLDDPSLGLLDDGEE